MYGLPGDFDPRVFVGRELEQVCFWRYSVHLVFDGDVSLTMESTFSVKERAGSQKVAVILPVVSSNLMSLIGKKILAASADRSGTLSLCFVGGSEIVCSDESQQYESYRIRI